MDTNRINVKIYGQGYTIAGERPREDIQKIADYVDRRMRDIAGSASLGSQTALAVLTAVNVADELFAVQEEIRELKSVNEQLEKDTKHYIGLWDEAKEKCREGNMASDDMKILEERYKELESNYFELQMENVQLKNRLDRSGI